MQYDNFASPKAGPRTPKAKGARPQNIPSESQSQPRTSRSKGTPDHHRRTYSHQHGRNSSNSYVQHDGAVSDTGHSSVTPAKQAYAGPTFHASPAASSLPMPKFMTMSKSTSDLPPSKLQEKMDAESDRNDHQTETEDDRESDVPVQRGDSPLDFFFKAQRAEKARNSSPLALGSLNNAPATSHRPSHTTLSQTKTPASSSKAMFMMEMDGAAEVTDSDAPVSAVPFHERLRAASNNSSPSQATSEDRSAELKKLLSMPTLSADQAAPRPSANPFDSPVRRPGYPNHGPPSGPHHQPSPQHAYRPSPHDAYHHNLQNLHYQSPQHTPDNRRFQQAQGKGSPAGFDFEQALRASAQSPMGANVQPKPAPATGAASSPPPAANIQQMEDNLRKILKLN